MARERRRRLAVLGGVGAVVVAATGAAVLITDESAPDVAIAGKPSPVDASERRTPGVSVRNVEVHGARDGSARVVFAFDGRLPDDRVDFVEDITAVDAPGIAYTVQDTSLVRVCDDRHWGFGPGATTGSIDVLIPSEWFAPGTAVDDLPHATYESVDPHPGKIVRCGPYEGFVQYSIWAPASDDPEDVRVSVDDDLRRLVVEIHPPSDSEPISRGAWASPGPGRGRGARRG